jgi:hypothetical protein
MSNIIGKLGRGYRFPVVETLPDLVEEGEIFEYEGQLWRGLRSGESGLPAGTPWPVKGYKEVVLRLSVAYEFTGVIVIISDFGAFGSIDAGVSIFNLPFLQKTGLTESSSDVFAPIGLDSETTGKICHGLTSIIIGETTDVLSFGLLNDEYLPKLVSETLIENDVEIGIRIYPPKPA